MSHISAKHPHGSMGFWHWHLTFAQTDGIKVGKFRDAAKLKPHSGEDLTMRNGLVDFSQKPRECDGFGVNYVEFAQSRTLRDYEADSQDYGGFGTLPKPTGRRFST